MTTPGAGRDGSTMAIRDVHLFVDVVGHGYPLLLMHGGPRADHWTMVPFRRLADRFTLIFYDHRCNGRSVGAPVSSMTFENLTADAEALRQKLGFERWAVLGHSFGATWPSSTRCGSWLGGWPLKPGSACRSARSLTSAVAGWMDGWRDGEREGCSRNSLTCRYWHSSTSLHNLRRVVSTAAGQGPGGAEPPNFAQLGSEQDEPAD
jgi:hypothetical protein